MAASGPPAGTPAELVDPTADEATELRSDSPGLAPGPASDAEATACTFHLFSTQTPLRMYSFCGLK